MSQRYVSLPAIGARVSLAQYVSAWKAAKANPEQTYSHGLNTSSPSTGAAVLREFRTGMHDRINTRGGVESAYRPELMGHHWQMQSYHPPAHFVLKVLARHSRITPAIAVEHVLGEFDYQMEYEIAVNALKQAIANRWVRVQDGTLVLTRRGKREHSRRIRAICKVH